MLFHDHAGHTRLGRATEAQQAFDAAAQLTQNQPGHDYYLIARRNELSSAPE